MNTKLVKPENVLKKKVGHGGFKEGDIVKAQSGLENNKIDFRPLAADLLVQLDAAIEVFKQEPVKTQEALNNIMFPMMQLKAQGSLFKYPAITKISHTTLDFLENLDRITVDLVAIIVGYRNAIKALMTLEIKDSAHFSSVQLLEELEKAFVRYSKARKGKI